MLNYKWNTSEKIKYVVPKICITRYRLKYTVTVTCNGHHGVSNYRSVECLFNRLFILTTNDHQRSELAALCECNPSENSPHEGSVTRKMFPFDDVIMTEKSVSNNYNPPNFFLANQYIHVMIFNLLLFPWWTVFPTHNKCYDHNRCVLIDWQMLKFTFNYDGKCFAVDCPRW